MLIQLLRADNSICRYICDECSDNGISINIDRTINEEDVLIIKVDRYYNHLVLDPDKSPDCLIIQRCTENSYILYIVELRNIDTQNGFTVNEIVQKFTNCLDDFIGHRFANYFYNTLFSYINIRLLFISDPYGFQNSPEKIQKMRGHKLDALMSQRIPKYFGKHIYIDHRIPNPTIRNCRIG